MDDHVKQALMGRFQAYLDRADETVPEPPEETVGETADLYSLFVELAGLRSEVRTESRLVKDALEQFRGVFDTLQASQADLRQELDRARSTARATAREQADAALRPLLLDVIDLRDRLLAALHSATAPPPGRLRRLWRRPAAVGEAWQEGLRMTLRRLDQVLLDRRVAPMALLGLPFDPRRARVVATRADRQAAAGTVVEEVRAGFLWDDQVLRTADVIVSKHATD